MIWYLLYPFRGTTEPPVLASNHPLRRAFYQYGAEASRHWLAFILFSVATAVLFCYPVFFLYENPTAGLSKLPYHVWTSARLFDGDAHTPPDVEIRQIWVHGSYMKALEQNVLSETLSIQDTIIAGDDAVQSLGAGDHFPESEGAEGQGSACRGRAVENVSWGFHSPLMFWNCSLSTVKADVDIIHTINSQARRRSYLNLTLRPTSVFAGKSFVKDKVVAADALVITIFNKVGKGENQHWDDRLSRLAEGVPSRWSMYPRDVYIAQGRLYEFQQKPMSLQDNVLLFISYLLMGVYFVVSLGKLRAVKSKLGLVVTVIFEIAISIIASFSICGMLQIDLARIPNAAYPFVVLVMGLENMFRLINAVLAQPPELHNIHRIATAVGEVGHLSLATAAQMLFILWMLSNVASGVAAFCIFAAVALMFDFVLHLTFFLAVLSVDVRRLELRDSLDRTSTAHTRRKSTARVERQYWLDALLRGQLPFSSRIAGSAISICFILGLNMHFYDSGSMIWSLVQSLRSMFHSHSQNTPFAAPPINQARTPAAWLRIQDYRYAQEILGIVKPNAHSIIARVYDPLAVVLRHSERNGVPSRNISFFMVFWDLISKHIYPFVLAIIFAVATVTLLMQYMLWNELPEEEPDSDHPEPSILSLATLPQAHRMDVIKLTACKKGHLISVSLDRLISISYYNPSTHRYHLNALTTAAMSPPIWPVVSIAIDDNGSWAALCSANGNVAFWNLHERRLSHFITIDLMEQQPCAFSLVPVETAGSDRLTLIVVIPNAWVTEVDVLSSTMHSFQISTEKLVCADVSPQIAGINVIVLTRLGSVRIAMNHSSKWVTSALEELDPRLAPSSMEGKLKSITNVPSLCVFAAVRLRVVDLVDIKTKSLIYTFPALLIKGHSLRVLNSPQRECRECHSSAIHSISLVYTDFNSNSCVMRTYSISNDHNDLICLAPKIAGRTASCNTLIKAKESVHTIPRAGSWEATNMQSIIGIRRRLNSGSALSSTDSTSSGAETQPTTTKPSKDAKLPANRRSVDRVNTSTCIDSEYSDEWEIWTLSASGEFHTLPLQSPVEDAAQSVSEDDLFIASLGPLARLGNRSVAVGFGNRVKVMMVGNERFEQDINEYQDLANLGGSRRKRPGSRKAL